MCSNRLDSCTQYSKNNRTNLMTNELHQQWYISRSGVCAVLLWGFFSLEQCFKCFHTCLLYLGRRLICIQGQHRWVGAADTPTLLTTWSTVKSMFPAAAALRITITLAWATNHLQQVWGCCWNICSHWNKTVTFKSSATLFWFHHLTVSQPFLNLHIHSETVESTE